MQISNGYSFIKTDCRKGLMATIWLLASGNCYRTESQLFGIPKASFARIVKSVAKLICAEFSSVITYNKDRVYYDVQVAKFAHRYGQANVCCAIDGTFIEIKRPKLDFGERYYSGISRHMD